MRLIKYKGCIYCHSARAPHRFIFQGTQVRMCTVCWKRFNQTNVRWLVEQTVVNGNSAISEYLETHKDEEWLRKV